MNYKNCEFLHGNFLNHSHNIGTFYKLPEKFPFILHDKNGCIFIDEKIFNDFKSFGHLKISISKTGPKINISKGISKLYGYRKCDSAVSCPNANFRK